MIAFLPPISRLTILFSRAHCSAMSLPVVVEPVNEISRTSSCPTSVGPTSSPWPLMRLTTPCGMPACSHDFDEIDRRKRHVLAGFDNDGVAANERRDQLPRRDRHRKIEWRDQPANPDRLTNAHREFVRHLGRRRKAVQPCGPRRPCSTCNRSPPARHRRFLSAPCPSRGSFRRVNGPCSYAVSRQAGTGSRHALAQVSVAIVVAADLAASTARIDVVRVRLRKAADDVRRVRRIDVIEPFARRTC